MNEPAVRVEEQIISVFAEQETQICRGWILKKAKEHLFIYPLYYKSGEDDISGRIRECEESARRSGIGCVFRIVEHTNYYLSAVLAESGYAVQRRGVVGVCEAEEARSSRSIDAEEARSCWSIDAEEARSSRSIDAEEARGCRSVDAEESKRGLQRCISGGRDKDPTEEIYRKKQGTLLITDRNAADHVNLQEFLQSAGENGIKRILADISGREDLPEQYEQAGFHRAYGYCIYQKKK